MDSKKLKAMMEWSKPTTIKALRSFLGLTGYCQKFIAGYGNIAAPLVDMLQKKNAFSWSQKAEEAFELLKQTMMQAPVLALPNFQLLFVVECDASGNGLGAVLMQEQRPIAYFSTALNGKRLLLSTYEKELMALVLTVKKWRPYLLGHHFVVQTNQHNLKFLWEQQIMTEPQQKWLLKLMGYDFSIEFKKGKNNMAANALSRKDTQGEFNAISSPLPQWLESIKVENQSHPELQRIHHLHEQGEAIGP